MPDIANVIAVRLADQSIILWQ